MSRVIGRSAVAGAVPSRRDAVWDKSSRDSTSYWEDQSFLHNAGQWDCNQRLLCLLQRPSDIFWLLCKWGRVCFMRLSFGISFSSNAVEFEAQQFEQNLVFKRNTSFLFQTGYKKVTSHTDLISWGPRFPPVALKALQKQKGVSYNHSHAFLYWLLLTGSPRGPELPGGPGSPCLPCNETSAPTALAHWDGAKAAFLPVLLVHLFCHLFQSSQFDPAHNL